MTILPTSTVERARSPEAWWCPSATAHEPGIGEAETRLELSELEGGQSYLVMVHALQGQPVACAEIPQYVLPESRDEGTV